MSTDRYKSVEKIEYELDTDQGKLTPEDWKSRVRILLGHIDYLENRASINAAASQDIRDRLYRRTVEDRIKRTRLDRVDHLLDAWEEESGHDPFVRDYVIEPMREAWKEREGDDGAPF